MITRRHAETLNTQLGRFPVVGLVGSRQVGKTTLARSLVAAHRAEYLDLELPSDAARLENPEYYLRQRSDQLVVIDEVQRQPELFPLLRALVDEDRRPGRFLLLGSAYPELLRGGSETLAGRVAWIELNPLDRQEAEQVTELETHWWRGGFPDALLAADDGGSRAWANAFIRTYLQIDVPAHGVRTPEPAMLRLLTTLANDHGNPWNAARLSRNLGLATATLGSYRDLLEQTFVLRVLPAFHRDVGKRLVRAPRTYIRDTGLLHALLRIRSRRDLLGHPALGASFEGYAIQQIASALPDGLELAYWRTHAGAELDLVVHAGGQPAAVIEVKFGDRTRPSRGFHEARSDLGDPPGFVVHAGDDSWGIDEGVDAVSVARAMELAAGW